MIRYYCGYQRGKKENQTQGSYQSKYVDEQGHQTRLPGVMEALEEWNMPKFKSELKIHRVYTRTSHKSSF